jgi:hypothetical protein
MYEARLGFATEIETEKGGALGYNEEDSPKVKFDQRGH